MLDRMIQNKRGISVYVWPEAIIERAVSSFCDKISKSVLTDPKLNVEDHYSYPLPDLFAASNWRSLAATVIRA